MAVINLTPDENWVLGTNQQLCAGREYLFTEDDPDVLLVEWCVTTPDGIAEDSVNIVNKYGRTSIISVSTTGTYSIFNKQENLA